MPPLNARADVSNVARGLDFGLGLNLHPYLMYASSEGSGESTHSHILPDPSLFENSMSTKISWCIFF